MSPRMGLGHLLSSARAYSVRNAVCSIGDSFVVAIPMTLERTPIVRLNDQPKTFTALEITSAAVDNATIA